MLLVHSKLMRLTACAPLMTEERVCPVHLYRSPLSVPVMTTSAEQNAAQRMDWSSPGGREGEREERGERGERREERGERGRTGRGEGKEGKEGEGERKERGGRSSW